jgi:predicted GNAT family N-acyltransferase
VGDPKNAKTVAYVNEGVSAAKERGWTFLAVTPEEKNELHSFLKTEFSARWAREFIVWGERADTQRGFWHLLRDEKNKLIGFSRMAVRGRHKPLSAGWTPGAIRLPLTAGVPRLDTDSCLGPIGISKSERGRGSGKILLALTIHEISLQGGVRTCIDWTNAYNYYTPLGFEIARRFLSVWKEL